MAAAVQLIKDQHETIPFPPEHESVKEIRYSKTISNCSLRPYGIIKIFFKKEEQMLKFPCTEFRQFGAVWLAKMEQNHELEAVFFDPQVDQHKQIDQAIVVFKKYLGWTI